MAEFAWKPAPAFWMAEPTRGRAKAGVAARPLETLGIATVMLRKGKGAALDGPDPASALAPFEANPGVTVQLLNSDGTCWGSTFAPTDFRTNTGTKAKATHRGP